MGNTPTRRSNDDKKWSDILTDIPFVETSILVQKIAKLNIKSDDEINILVNTIVNTAYSNENFAKSVATFLKGFHDTLSFDSQEILKDCVSRDFELEYLRHYSPEKTEEYADLITQLFNFDLIQVEVIVRMLEVKFPDKNFEKKIHQLILDKVEAKVTYIVNTMVEWQIPYDIIQLQRLIAANKLQNRELTLSEKSTCIEEILSQVNLTSSDMIEQILPLKLKTSIEIDMFVKKVIESVTKTSNSSKYAEVILRYFTSLTVDNKKHLMKSVNNNLLHAYQRNGNLQVFTPEDVTKAKRLIEFITELFNMELIHSEIIIIILSINFIDERLKIIFSNNILEKIEDKVTDFIYTFDRDYISQATIELYETLMYEGLTQGVKMRFLEDDVKEMSEFKKVFYVTMAFNQINTADTFLLAQNLLELHLENFDDEIDWFAGLVIQNATRNENSSANHAEFIKTFYTSMRLRKQKNFREIFSAKISTLYEAELDELKVIEITKLMVKLYNFDFIISKDIQKMLSKKFPNEKLAKNVRRLIITGIKDKVNLVMNEIPCKNIIPFETIELNEIIKTEISDTKHTTASAQNAKVNDFESMFAKNFQRLYNSTASTSTSTTVKVNNVPQKSSVSVIETKISNKKDKIQVVEKINSQTQSSPVIDKPQIENSVQTTTNSTTSASTATNQPKNLQNNKQAEKKTILVKYFEDYLMNLIHIDESQFDFTKFNLSSSNERSECVRKLMKFAIENSPHADKLASFTNELVTFGYKSSCKDIPKFLTDNSEDKLKLFNSQNKNWIEIEGFGVFLAHMYVLEVQKIYLMNTWLDETTKLAYESDFALKMLLRVLKIVHQKMNRKDPNSYQVYRKELTEFKNKFPQGIPKMYENWIDEFLGVSRSQNAPNMNQNTRSSSVVSITSDKSTASKAQSIKNSQKSSQNQKKEVQSQLIHQFDGHLKSLKNSDAPGFNIMKFATSSQAERKECIRRLVKFASENHKCAEKLAKLTQLLMTFNFGEKKIKDFSQLLVEGCDKKLNIFKSEHKDWIEMEGFGIFLAHLYLLNLLKKILMITWMDEVKKLAVENDLALKMFLKVFKIIHGLMKQKDVLNYRRYLKDVEEFMNNCPQRIPKLHKNWIDEVLGVSKSQNVQPSTSNLSQNQNIRSSSVASSTSDVSTASKTQVSTGAIRKVLPPAKSELCTEFQKYLNNFDGIRVLNFNVELFNEASDTAIQACALLLIEELFLNKRSVQNYVLATFTIFYNISDESKQMKFKKNLNDYILAEMNKSLKVEKPNESNWDRVSKLNTFICELHKDNISETSTVAAWLNRLQIMSSNGCIEAKQEYDICLEKTTERIFQAFLKAIQEKTEVIFPNKMLNDASDSRVKAYANNFIQHSIAYPENFQIYVKTLQNIILPSFSNAVKKNVFMDHMKKCLVNNIESILKKNATNFDRVTKINPFICELYNEDLIDSATVKIWRARLEEMAKDGNVKTNNELKIFKLKMFDRNLINVREPQVKEEPNEFNQFKLILNDLNNVNQYELIKSIENIKIDSTEKLENFTKFYFNHMMRAKENFSTYADLPHIIDQHTCFEFDFKGKIIELILAEFFKHAKDFNTKSSDDVKMLEKLIVYIGEFYNDTEWIDFIQIQSCLTALAANKFETSLQIELFHQLLKIITIKLISTGNGVHMKEFFDSLTAKTKAKENNKAIILLNCCKLYSEMKKIYESSRIFNTNINDFVTILQNLNERNIKESAEKFKSMKIYEIDECSLQFVDICIEKSENVENFVKLLAKIGDIEVYNIESKTKTNFKTLVFDKIHTRYCAPINNSQTSSSAPEYAKIFKLIANLYKEDVMTIHESMFYLDQIIRIKLETSFDILEYLIPLIGAKLDNENERVLSYIIVVSLDRSKSENDKERVEKLLEMRQLYSLDQPKNSNSFDKIIKDLENVTNFSSLATQMKPKILANEKTMKEFAQAVYNCCINDEYLTDLTMKFCKYLTENEKFKEIFSIFIQLKLISIKIEDKMKFDAVRLVANCYKIDLIDDETFKPWLSAKILDDLTYNELSELSGIIADKNSGDFSYLDELMNEKFMKMCEEIKNDLKNVEISIEKQNNDGDEEELEAVD